MLNGKTRSTLYGVVGAYLVYLAYGLFKEMADPNTTMSPAMRVLFMALFALAGAGLVVYALLLWKRALDEEKDGSQDDQQNIK